MVGHRFSFRPAEVRAMLALSHALHEIPSDPAARKRALLEGLCRLLRAHAGFCVVSHVESDPQAPAEVRSVTLSVVRYGLTEEDAHTLAARYRSGPGVAAVRRRRGRFGRVAQHDPALVESVLDVPGMNVQACVALLRRRPTGRGFGKRERTVLDFVHHELAWIYRAELPLPSPDGLSLSPRQRQTLQLLLDGNSEKQIASQMGLSPNTVHHYVKAIHRHLRVSSRSELLARWVRK
jgi:DNA-binding NarL/FixJ family response regulator